MVDPVTAEESLVHDDLRGAVGRTGNEGAAVAEEGVLAVVPEYLVDAGTSRDGVVIAATADGIVACIAVDRVIARTAVDIVGVVSAGECVIARAPEDPVGAVATGDGVVAVSFSHATIDRAAPQATRHDPLHAIGDPRFATRKVLGIVVGRRRRTRYELRQVDPPLVLTECRIAAPEAVTAVAAVDHRVIACAADDEVVTLAAAQCVGPRLAIDRVIASEGIDDVSPKACPNCVGPIVTIDDVDVGRLARDGRGVVVKIAIDEVTVGSRRHAAARHEIAAVDRVTAGPADDRVGAKSAADDVVARTAPDRVVAGIAPDDVVVGRRKKRFGAGHDDVDPGIAIDRVIAATAVDRVRGVGVGGRGIDDAWRQEAGLDPVVSFVFGADKQCTHRGLVGDTAGGVDRAGIRIPVELIAAAAAGDRVVAGAANDEVGTRSRVDGVFPRLAKDRVVATARRDFVVAAAGPDQVAA